MGRRLNFSSVFPLSPPVVLLIQLTVIAIRSSWTGEVSNDEAHNLIHPRVRGLRMGKGRNGPRHPSGEMRRQ
jgi:hypothetical protein